MGTIRRGTIANNFVEGLKLDVGNKDLVPNQTSDKVVLTYDYSNAKYCDIVRRAAAVNSTSGTIYTTSTDEDFYLCGASLSVIKDATSTSIASQIRVIIGGGTYQILDIAGITLTAATGSQTITFNPPLKIDRGSSILVTNSTNVANVSADACIFGFYKRG